MAQKSDVGLKCLKYMLFLSNFMFLIIGALMIFMGNSIVSIYHDLEIFIESEYFSPALFVISIGAIVIVVSSFGCVGAVLHSTLLINIYTLLMCILLILEISAAITALVKHADVENYVASTMYHSMSFYKNRTDVADSWNLVQSGFGCCGVYFIKNWAPYEIDEAQFALTKNYTFGIPKSCCAISDCSIAFRSGCLDLMVGFISESSFLLGTGAICVSIVQILGIAFGNMLAKSVRREKSKQEMLRQQREMMYNQINNGKSTLYE